jgi:hypothetical protein
MTADERMKNPWTTVGGIVGAAVGFYCGFMLLIPSVVTVVAFMILKKIELPRVEAFKLGIAVILGHTAWFVVGFFAPHSKPWIILPDIVLAMAGVVWLCVRPGIGPVLYVIAFEVLSLLVNLSTLSSHHFGRMQHKALVAHIALRLFIAASCWLAWKQASKNKPTLTPPPIPPLPHGTPAL